MAASMSELRGRVTGASAAGAAQRHGACGATAPPSGPDDGAYVRFDNVHKTYDGETLVASGLNLDIAQGEFVTLLGPSGSGKTTSLMMLAGFESPTHGRILLDGQELNRVPPHRRNIGMVFQNYALFPHMSVSENLAFPLKIRKQAPSEIAARVQRALAMVHLEAFAKRRPQQLSGGQQQRVAVARALVFEPSIVLMDEPLGALDKNLREELQYEIKSLHDRLGITMVYVTHDQSEALTMSDRIGVFNHGEVQQLGSPRSLYEEPRNAFVASFIGENNRISGQIERIDGTDCLVRLQDSDDTILARAVGALGPGDGCVLSVRPECVLINPKPRDGSNVFQARVEEILFKGDHLRARLSACGSDDFIIKVSDPEAASALGVGRRLRIGWNKSLCRAFKVTNASSMQASQR